MALYASSNFGRLRQVFMDYLTEAQKKELDGFLRGYGWGDGYPDFIARVVSLILTEFLEKWHKGQSVNNLDQFVERFSTFIMQQQKGAEELLARPLLRSRSRYNFEHIQITVVRARRAS